VSQQNYKYFGNLNATIKTRKDESFNSKFWVTFYVIETNRKAEEGGCVLNRH